jgi:hypothetical protein
MKTQSDLFIRIRWPLLLTGVIVVSALTCWWLSSPQPTRAEAAPQQRAAIDKAAPASQLTTVYDPDPQHLWNRLHDAFRSRTGDGKTGDPWELDPFLWQNEQYLASEKGLKTSLDVLDEFIAKNGHTLIKDPLKRALLQRDLWTLFDSLSVPRLGAVQKNPQMELAIRVARIIPRLSLTADEIKKLPDNYAEAVAAKEGWFLPGDLWDPKGPWVLLSDEAGLPLAVNHVHFFGGRSTFYVFLRLSDEREQTVKYLGELRKLAPGSKPAPLPAGIQVAIVRQMQLIDDKGKRVTTNITESLHIRTQEPSAIGEFELKLNRRELLAAKPSLKLTREDDRERDYLLFMGNNAGQGPSKILGSCFSCHQGRGFDSVLSYRRFKPPPLTSPAHPELIASTREKETISNRSWKVYRYEWGLLQGLIQNSPKD